MRETALFIRFFWKQIAVIAAIALIIPVIVSAIVGSSPDADRSPSSSAAATPAKSYREDSTIPAGAESASRDNPSQRSAPAPRRITFTAFELECMQWSDSFIGTDWYSLLRDNPSQYNRFKSNAVPLCEDMAQKARNFCRVARSEGHDPAEYVRQRDASLEVIGAVHIWCD